MRSEHIEGAAAAGGRASDSRSDWASLPEQASVGELRASRVIEGVIPRGRSYERDELQARVLRMRRVVLGGGIAWLFFLPTDLTFNLMRGSSHGWTFVLLRLLSTLPLVFAGLRLRREPSPTRRTLDGLELICMSSIAAATGIMTVLSGGLDSPILAALLPILVVRAVAIPDDWRRTFHLSLAPVLSFWVVMVIGLLTSAQAHAFGAAQQATLLVHLSMQLATIGLITAANYSAWEVRRNLYRARTVSRYELRRLLGRGGMGEVWAAWNPLIQHEVALKILPVERADTLAALRFEREIAATIKLRHPNTVRVFDYGLSADGFWYYAMELLEGETLAELVAREGPLALSRALGLLRQAASALHEAHRSGIIHRDIKPENLFVSSPAGQRDFIKVLDFGVATVAAEVLALAPDPTAPLDFSDSQRDGPTEPGYGSEISAPGRRAVGTPLYLSPEVASGGAAGPQSDIYALGCVLYFALTGRPVFIEQDVESLLRAHVERAPQPPSELLAEGLPEYVEKLVMRCLAKDPVRRYDHARALVGAIDLCLRLGENDRRRGAVSAEQPRLRAGRERVEAWAKHSRTDTDMSLIAKSDV